MFGMDAAQVARAGEIMRVLAADWRELVAGSEGFLTGRGREGLSRQRVVWGEMDSMVCFCLWGAWGEVMGLLGLLLGKRMERRKKVWEC